MKGVCDEKSPPISSVAATSCSKKSSPISPVENENENEYGVLHKGLAEYMSKIRKDINELRVSSIGIVQRLNGLEQRITAVEPRNMTSKIKQKADLEGVVAKLKVDLNERDQEALLADLDIGGLLGVNGGNISHFIMVLGTKHDHNIVYTERVVTNRKSDTSGGADLSARPRRVVIRLARRNRRDKAARIP